MHDLINQGHIESHVIAILMHKKRMRGKQKTLELMGGG
jgi:hypothetical protein